MRFPCSFRTALIGLLGALFITAGASAGAPQVILAPALNLGNPLANIAAPGDQPEQVDAALITHMRGDRVGGLVADGKIAFPNATVHAEQRDAAFWLDKAQLEKAPEAMKDFLRGAQMSHLPFPGIGRLRTEGKGYVLVPLTYSSVR